MSADGKTDKLSYISPDEADGILDKLRELHTSDIEGGLVTLLYLKAHIPRTKIEEKDARRLLTGGWLEPDGDDYRIPDKVRTVLQASLRAQIQVVGVTRPSGPIAYVPDANDEPTVYERPYEPARNPRLGDHPGCCNKARRYITLTADNGTNNWLEEGDWTIQLAANDFVRTLTISHCPWCGHVLVTVPGTTDPELVRQGIDESCDAIDVSHFAATGTLRFRDPDDR